MDNSAFTSLFIFFVTTILIIIAAYYATRFIGQKAAGLSRKKQVSLLEKSILPGNLSIEVVKMADQVYVIATRGKEMTLLDKFSMDKWLEMKLSEESKVYDGVHPKNGISFRKSADYFKKILVMGERKENE